MGRDLSTCLTIFCSSTRKARRILGNQRACWQPHKPLSHTGGTESSSIGSADMLLSLLESPQSVRTDGSNALESIRAVSALGSLPSLLDVLDNNLASRGLDLLDLVGERVVGQTASVGDSLHHRITLCTLTTLRTCTIDGIRPLSYSSYRGRVTRCRLRYSILAELACATSSFLLTPVARRQSEESWNMLTSESGEAITETM